MGSSYWIPSDFKGCCVAEPVSKKVERLEKELADAKARLAAEAVKPKTVGEKAVEGMFVEWSSGIAGDKNRYIKFSDGSRIFRTCECDFPVHLIRDLNATVAAAIDKAVDEAKAEQRERDAKVCEGWADHFDSLSSDYCKHKAEAYRLASAFIRNPK